MASAEHVQVKMRDSLAAVTTGVRHDAKALRTELLADFTGLSQQMAEHGLMRAVNVSKRLDQLLRDHQNMHRSDGRDVVKGEANIVFIDLVARQLAAHYAGEDGGLLCGFAHRVLL